MTRPASGFADLSSEDCTYPISDAIASGDLARRVPEAVAVLLKLYETERTDGESPADFYRRVDPKRVVAVLGDLAAGTPHAGEEIDIGEETGFQVAIGAGECAA